MRKLLLAFLSAFVFSSIALLQSGDAASNMTSGQVMKVDQSAGKITLKHGPMKKFNMDEGMTMVYQVQDPDLLSVLTGNRRAAAQDIAPRSGLPRAKSLGQI